MRGLPTEGLEAACLATVPRRRGRCTDIYAAASSLVDLTGARGSGEGRGRGGIGMRAKCARLGPSHDGGVPARLAEPEGGHLLDGHLPAGDGDGRRPGDLGLLHRPLRTLNCVFNRRRSDRLDNSSAPRWSPARGWTTWPGCSRPMTLMVTGRVRAAGLSFFLVLWSWHYLKKQCLCLHFDERRRCARAVTREELEARLVALRRASSTDDGRGLQLSMTVLDSDGSGTVTINEFVAAAMHQRLAQRPAALDVAFAAIDTDQSGLLEPDELLALLVKTDPTASLAVLVAEVEAALGTAEALNRIDFEEMMRLDDTFQGYRSQATSIRLDRALSATLLDLDFASVSQSR